MASLDDQMKRIADKAALHRMIDDLSDDAEVVVIANTGECGDRCNAYFCLGDVGHERAYFMVAQFQDYLMGWSKHPEE